MRRFKTKNDEVKVISNSKDGSKSVLHYGTETLKEVVYVLSSALNAN